MRSTPFEPGDPRAISVGQCSQLADERFSPIDRQRAQVEPKGAISDAAGDRGRAEPSPAGCRRWVDRDGPRGPKVRSRPKGDARDTRVNSAPGGKMRV
jgi:hypothetical protein